MLIITQNEQKYVIDRADQEKVDSTEGSECSVQTCKQSWKRKIEESVEFGGDFSRTKNQNYSIWRPKSPKAQDPALGIEGAVFNVKPI